MSKSMTPQEYYMSILNTADDAKVPAAAIAEMRSAGISVDEATIHAEFQKFVVSTKRQSFDQFIEAGKKEQGVVSKKSRGLDISGEATEIRAGLPSWTNGAGPGGKGNVSLWDCWVVAVGRLYE